MKGTKLNVLNTKDETRNKVPDKVSELSVPDTHFDQQQYTPHMVRGQIAQTNQVFEFLTGYILTPREQPSHYHQKLSTEITQDINLPLVEQTQ